MKHTINVKGTVINLHHVNTASLGYEMVTQSTDGELIKAPRTYITFSRGGDTIILMGDFVTEIQEAIEKMYLK